MTEITAHHGLFRDTKLHVDDPGGSGRPVVLIHGWPLYGKSWAEQIEPLSQAGYRPITYDRRGFGRSDRPRNGYDYDTLTEDLHTVITELDLHDATIVGFSMGGGEVARYFGEYGGERVRSAVFAAAVPPYLLQSDDNPDGPLPQDQAKQFADAFESDEGAFYDMFITQFVSANEQVVVSDAQHREIREECELADHDAAGACMQGWATSDFRGDLPAVNVPALVIHGDADALVPFEGSGKRTHEAIEGSQLHVIAGGPHALNVSHAGEFNRVLIDFLGR